LADNVQSYSTVEPAIDLTALTPLGIRLAVQHRGRPVKAAALSLRAGWPP
jgi:hypothetical protein